MCLDCDVSNVMFVKVLFVQLAHLQEPLTAHF